jgi:hypothetical protein
VTNDRWVVVDTNVFAWLQRIDDECGLIDLICDAYSGRGVADHGQLAIMDYCLRLSSHLKHHDVTDEQVIAFTLDYLGRFNLSRINDDPVDLKLVVFAIEHKGSWLLTCETKLLQLSEEQGVHHACFKAAIHNLHTCVGGIFNDDGYATAEMFETGGRHPYYHYSNDRRCGQCDSSRLCATRQRPPTR